MGQVYDARRLSRSSARVFLRLSRARSARPSSTYRATSPGPHTRAGTSPASSSLRAKPRLPVSRRSRKDGTLSGPSTWPQTCPKERASWLLWTTHSVAAAKSQRIRYRDPPSMYPRQVQNGSWVSAPTCNRSSRAASISAACPRT